MRRWITVFTGGLGLVCAAYAQAPSITAVLDAAAYTSGVAQGSVFVVKGTNLSGSGYVPASALPLGATLNGVKITFTPAGGGAGTDAYMVYTYNVGGVNQLAALLPSSVATGDYNVTVTNGSSASAGFRTTVLARKFGIITQDGSGSGNGVVQNFISQTQYDVNRLTTGTYTTVNPPVTYSPSHRGQVIVIWGTGMGAITGADNTAPGAIDFRSQVQVQVLVGGQTVTPDYAGRAPSLPGTDEIILTLPANTGNGCAVDLQVSVGGQLSNAATIAIAPVGADACDSQTLSREVLQRLDQGGTITTGSFLLSSFAAKVSVAGFNLTAKQESGSGAFTQFSGAQLASALQFQNPPGSCRVFHRIGTQTALLFAGGGSLLDAGQSLTLAGPNITAANSSMKRDAGNLYYLDLGIAISGITLPFPIPGYNSTPTITAGTYTLTGTGGAQVGAFQGSVTLGPAIVVAPDLPATVNRSQGVTVTWTGGAATDLVQVIGISGTTIGGTADSPVFDAGAFICTAPASAGRLVVPASITAQLPATPANFTTGTGIGYLIAISNSAPSVSSGTFTAPLIGGGNIDLGVFLGAQGFASQAAFQ